jgi:hypothetical protein
MRNDPKSGWRRVPSLASSKVKVAADVVQSSVRQNLIEATAIKIEKLAESINQTLTPEHMFHIAAAYERLSKEAKRILPKISEHAVITDMNVKGEVPDPDETGALGVNQVVEKKAGIDSVQHGKSSLNTIFNLGLLSAKNIDYLKNKTDFLDDAEDFFCKLLLTTRLTGLEIEEDALIASLEAITQSRELIDSLGFGLGV